MHKIFGSYRWLCFSLLWPALCAAVEPPVDAGSLLQQQQRSLDAPSLAAPAAPVLRTVPDVGVSATNGARVLVRRFRVEGRDLVFPAQRLLALLEPVKGQFLSLDELREAAQRITALYREQGYFLARAVLPPQDVTDGVITVLVLEGRLDEADGVRLNIAPSVSGASPSRLNSELAKRIVTSPLRVGQPLRLSDVERGVLLLGDLPGVSAGANLEPGSAPDTTRMVVDVAEQPLWHGSLSADNHGSRYTSSNLASLQLDADNPSGRGDEASLQLTASPNGDYRYARLGYSALASAGGLRLGGSLSGLNYRVGQELAALDARGSAQVLGLSSRYPLLRSRNANVWANLSGDVKQLRNQTLGTATSDKRVHLFSAGLSGDRTDDMFGPGTTLADLRLSVGRLNLAANADNLQQDQGLQGAKTQGSFTKINVGTTRVARAHPSLTLITQVQGQWADKNLDSSEKFLLGGVGGVRAYPSGEAAGDTGMRASVDARWLALSHAAAGELTLLAFADWGRIRQFKRPGDLVQTTPNHVQLAGVGVGALLTRPGQWAVRAQWAHQIGANAGRNPLTAANADGRSSRSRVWVDVRVSF